MRIYEISRRDFLKGLGAAGVAAATGRLPAGIAAEPAAAATAVEAGSIIDGLVAAATSWTVKNMDMLYLDSSYSEAPEFEEWQPGVNDLTEIGNGPHGTMPWGSHFETGISKGGVPWLHTSFGDENPYEALLTYQDPNTKKFESVRLEYDPQTYGIDSTTDEEGNTVDENDVGSYVDRRVAGTLEDEPEDAEEPTSDPTDVATKAAVHSAAEFGLDRLAQLAGIKALGGKKSAEDPTDIDLDTMIKNYKDTYGDVSKDQEEPLALPNKSDDELDQILKPGSIKSKQTVKK